MDSIAIVSALAVGASLGLLGSGGSILTVPILVYILHRPEKLAIAESLAIVGSIALAGALSYAIRHQVHWRSVLLFGSAGILGAYCGAYGSFYCIGPMQLILFGVTMLLAAWMMLRNGLDKTANPSSPKPHWILGLNGLAVGILTGLIGVGGGFLIVPALVLFCSLSMHFAIGTSLAIIAMNALIGFLVQLAHLSKYDAGVNWELIVLFASIGIVGSLIGSSIGSLLPQTMLRRVFGFSVIPLGLYMVLDGWALI